MLFSGNVHGPSRIFFTDLRLTYTDLKISESAFRSRNQSPFISSNVGLWSRRHVVVLLLHQPHFAADQCRQYLKWFEVLPSVIDSEFKERERNLILYLEYFLTYFNFYFRRRIIRYFNIWDTFFKWPVCNPGTLCFVVYYIDNFFSCQVKTQSFNEM